MSFAYTPKQQEVIDARDCNVLVSAAAGSGKTAVLTERIVNVICDEEHPVDVDRLLVVTFTSAAAAEMRERIGKKISERLQEHPESERLQRQATLLHNAQITTIDSFCLFLVKNHFNEIGLDPAFRVADEREIKLLQQEALSELLEERFEEGREEFFACVEALCPKGKEKALEEHVLSLSRYAASFPWPEEWLTERKKDYGLEGQEAFYSSEIWKYFLHYLHGVLTGCVQRINQAISIAQMPDGPYFYGELLDSEKEQLERIDVAGLTYEQICAVISGITFGKLPGVKDASVDKDKREYVKDVRDGVKKTLTDLETQFLSASFSGLMSRSAGCQSVADELIDLVIDFDRRMREKKTEKKLIDARTA